MTSLRMEKMCKWVSYLSYLKGFAGGTSAQQRHESNEESRRLCDDRPRKQAGKEMRNKTGKSKRSADNHDRMHMCEKASIIIVKKLGDT